MRSRCIILAGPNGSGKSTVYDYLKSIKALPFINADNIERELAKDNAVTKQYLSAVAGRATVLMLNDHLKTSSSFVFETTLSSSHSLRVIKEASSRNYQVELHYIFLRNPVLNVERVANRVRQGGHDIPEEAIIRRYDKSLGNVKKAVRLSDNAYVYDNSFESPAIQLRIDDKIIRSMSFNSENKPYNIIKRQIEFLIDEGALSFPVGTPKA